jgi:hypothetical protein
MEKYLWFGNRQKVHDRPARAARGIRYRHSPMRY